MELASQRETISKTDEILDLLRTSIHAASEEIITISVTETIVTNAVIKIDLEKLI